jgi:mono/diheme cytochrome c family protein
MVCSVALILIAVVSVVYAPTPAAVSSLGELVAEGEEWWKSSPDPRDPVACATCHYDRNETRGWAASFPKYRPLPPPDGRVMTLLQANAEAVRRHYRLAHPERPAFAITVYLVSRGVGAPVSPGIVAGQPVFEGRLRALDESVWRGERLFARGCRRCHAPRAVAGAALLFPRTADGQVESLEGFLGHHGPERPPLRWDGQPTTDIIAFLMSRLAGQPVRRLARALAIK